MITVIKSTKRLSHLSWLLLTLWLQATTFAFAGTLTLTDSNGDAYQLTIVDEVLLRPDGSVSVPISESVKGGPNIPPVAHDDNSAAFNDHTIDIPVLANDSDQDAGYPLSIALIGNSVGGDFMVLPNNRVRFVPFADFVGTATQDYQAIDSEGGLSNTATIWVEVTDDFCPSDPVPGWTRDLTQTAIAHCNFGEVSQYSLSGEQYFALQMNMDYCPEASGRVFYGPLPGGGPPIRVTISRCPGVFDDSYPPIQGNPFATVCSRPSVPESTVLWTLDNMLQFRCEVLPGQRVYLNAAFGSDSNPPLPTCDSPLCNIVFQPLPF